MSSLFNLPWQQAFDSSGNTLAGAKLYFYVAGTSTPQSAYADIGLGTPLSNPVVANGAGRFVPIYLDDTAYKVALYDSQNNLIWTADNVYAQSIDADASVAIAAIRATTISAGFPEEQAEDATNFVQSVYKYSNSANWYNDAGSEENVYILTGVDNYTRPADYFEGQHIWFVTTRPNTGASTVNVISMGQKNIFRADGSALQAGDILGMVHLVFNGTSFLLQEPSSLSMMQILYPVGSVYFGTQASCPLEVLIPNSTWSKVGTSILLGTSTSVPVKGNGKALGITHNGSTNYSWCASTNSGGVYSSIYRGAYTSSNLPTNVSSSEATATNVAVGVTTDGSKSGLIADLSSDKLSVNIWQRTA